MFKVVNDHVFPFLRTLGGDDSTYAYHMKDARFTNPDITYRDSLAQDHAGEEEKYSLVLANPPFAGSLDYENVAKDLLQIVKTKKTELLFLACSSGCSTPTVPDAEAKWFSRAGGAEHRRGQNWFEELKRLVPTK